MSEEIKLKSGSRLYLAHSVAIIESVRRWELHVQGQYNIDLINPMHNNKFENYQELKKLKTQKNILKYMQGLDTMTNKMIVEGDLNLLRRCDGLLAVFKTPTIGTIQEIFAAHFLFNMPVYIIGGEHIVHPWLSYIVEKSGGRKFKYRVEFERWLKEQGLKKE